jgi:DNA-binding response OmpR family regulator/two-component sensor histidine kinase
LINDILDLSKIEAGKMELHLENFDLRAILFSVKNAMSSLFKNKNQKFEIDTENELPNLYGDSGKIKQVIINLLSNANKFTYEGGIITVKAKKSMGYDKFVEISVTDTGRGIRQEDIGILFDEFRQLGTLGTKGEKGTGLGLALCKHFVEMQNGKIWVESEYGKGSKFIFTVPIAKEVIPEVIPKVIPINKPALPDIKEIDTKINVLVVEDDEKASRLLKYYLEPEGYNVFIASNGNDAIQMAKEIHPKVITLDILLPDKDGWEILKELKTNPETENIPVIIVSMLDNKDLGYSLDADDYFVKPVDKNKLLQKIKELSSIKYESNGTILIIDDDPKSVRLTASILEDSGYNVLKTYGGKEGIELAKTQKPQLIILDLLMPELSGFEVVEQLRSDVITKNVPIIVLTAKDLTKEDTDILNGHIKKLMMKTNFDKKELIREIKKHI